MIRRRRHAEPEALRQQRVWRVAAWVLYQLGELAEPPGVDEGYNLEEVREALLTAQHFSCGYCGFPIDKTGTTLEHFRPRGLYPWLSWTWENIWLSCPTCATKGAGFPLFDETRRLTSSTMFSLEQEAPCWLDPGVDDPREHLIYYIGTRGYQEGWLGRTPRGLATASDFKLNRERREGLMGLYRYHQTHLDRYCKQIEQLIEEAKIEALSDAWWELELSFFYPGAPYRDMAWWYLRHRFDDATLSAHGLNMPPWPDDNPAPPATWPVVLDMMERPPWLEGKALWWTRYISARGTAPSDQLRSALLALLQCAPAPHSIAALCAQLNRAEVTLVPLLRALKNAKLLTETPQGWCLA